MHLQGAGEVGAPSWIVSLASRASCDFPRSWLEISQDWEEKMSKIGSFVSDFSTLSYRGLRGSKGSGAVLPRACFSTGGGLRLSFPRPSSAQMDGWCPCILFQSLIFLRLPASLDRCSSEQIGCWDDLQVNHQQGQGQDIDSFQPFRGIKVLKVKVTI